MKIFNSLKLHILVYRRYFLLFWFFSFIAYAMAIALIKDREMIDYSITIYMLASLIVFSFAVGYYGHAKLAYFYLNIKISRSTFLAGNFIFTFLNALFQTIMFLFISKLMLQHLTTNNLSVSEFDYNSFKSYFILFLSLLSSILIANFIALYIGKFARIPSIVYILIVGLTVVFGYVLKDILMNNIIYIFSEGSNTAIICNFIIIIIAATAICFKFKNLDIAN